MRAYRLILILIPFMTSCQTLSSAPSSKGIYYEDLSVHRPALPDHPVSRESEVRLPSPVAVTPSGHISALLDSINAIIAARQAQVATENGFTIQVYNGSSRSQANSVVGRLRLSFPQLDSKVRYSQPDYKVLVGFFHNRLAAYPVYEAVKERFPRALLAPTQKQKNDE